MTHIYPYLAGIIDGEGCIRIGRNKGNGQYVYSICVGMVSKNVIELLRDTFGGTISEECVLGRRSIWRWNLRKQQELLSCLEKIRPYLMVKGEQADLIVKAISERAVRDCTKGPVKLSSEELQFREELYLKMKKLNAVGAAATTNRKETREG